MTDLTAITTPFGLLDKETQEALRAHGGPYEWLNWGGEWEETAPPSWSGCYAYRVKPQPKKPREWWAAFVGDLHHGMWPTEELAHDAMRGCTLVYSVIHVREVL